LLLKDRSFKITEATIVGALVDPYWSQTYNGGRDRDLLWDLNIETEERIFKDERWAPSVYHNALRLPIRQWMDLSGQMVEWNAPFDEATGEHSGFVYVFGHEDITQATLRFLQRNGCQFHIQWEGTCNVLYEDEEDEDDEYGENVPFSVEAVAT